MTPPTPIYNATTDRTHYITHDCLPPNQGKPPQPGDRISPQVPPAPPSQPQPQPQPPHPHPQFVRWEASPTHPSTYGGAPPPPPPPPCRTVSPWPHQQPPNNPNNSNAVGHQAATNPSSSARTTSPRPPMVFTPVLTPQRWRYVTRDGMPPNGGRPPCMFPPR